jgi:hypothetical protein
VCIKRREPTYSSRPMKATALRRPTACSSQGSCNAGCSATDSQGPYATGCYVWMSGHCEGKGDLTPLPPYSGDGTMPSGGGADNEPFYCSGPGPYQVVLWENANFTGRCVYREAGGSPYGPRTDVYGPWIEQPYPYSFYSNRLSAVAVGSRLLEVFNHRDFGQSFGTWWPNSWINYVGDYANDKVSSYKIYVAN